MTPGSMAISIKRSMSALAVTHTGHPGPEIRVMPRGAAWRIPYREMAMVWVPQTSMIFSSAPRRSFSSSSSRCTWGALRNSSR